MIRKVLVANRGEIAIRIMRTCREMGIEPVMIYSTADREALHVELAGTTVCVGGPAPGESYLNMKNILAAALGSGCDAIHPGYGFLAERADFAELVIASGLKFIGPRPETIRLLGNKARARQLMMSAGVPVTPGSDGILDSVDEAVDLADQLGFPILLKADAGGGGRGMRRVDQAADLPAAYVEATNEAEQAFGNGALYMEKLISAPKHLEFQILADAAGNVIHLGERDCSLQRRRQKMIEESPCATLSPELRDEMGAAAIRAAQAADYLGAGTVEFVLDNDGNYYFIEVNTRIQVEHPVTEVLTGIDLIREQIRIASGQNLTFSQEDIRLDGHAIECRINAESPEQDFRPSPGRIERFVMPGGPGVRIDSAVYPGCSVSPRYDSMIGKVIVHARNRREAVRRMRRCLEELIIEGIDTNVMLLYVLLYEKDFIRGTYNTEYVEAHLPRLLEYISNPEAYDDPVLLSVPEAYDDKEMSE
ncbi:MAG: acetyl-CoA carboxylase biotin carboxylase subunit [Clostridiaceae bacterium]|nr:acetyl-CoA carboxylase biotin carboxylase subunit [Clostridiaceae bacterium]